MEDRITHPENILEDETLHTEETKKQYSRIEWAIKGGLNEIKLLNDMGSIWEKRPHTSRWLSINKDFTIREYSLEENPKFVANPANIKGSNTATTVNLTTDSLLECIDLEIEDPDIASKYKNGVLEFVNTQITKPNIKALWKLKKKSPKFYWYLYQANSINNIKERNVRLQVAKILFDKFWEEAFNENNTLSQRSLDYIFTIFYNATLIREQRNKSIDEVFHDTDFPFISQNVKVDESNYIDAITYLVNEEKNIYFGEWWNPWKKKWDRKTSNFADILRALTDDQLHIHEINFKNKEKPTFEWDNTTNNIYNNFTAIMGGIIDIYNDSHQNNKMRLTSRTKSIASCTSKIFESKKINDAIWLRISSRWISWDNFWDIIQISRDRFKAIKADLKWHPEKYIDWYTPDCWKTISIKEISIDNKNVLDDTQIDEVIDYLNENLNNTTQEDKPNFISIFKRPFSWSPYISSEERTTRMTKHYPEIVNDSRKRKISKAFYKSISNWPARWKNWDYKDFKYNIICEIKDKEGNCMWERTIEVQFDDIDNGIWLANFNIRNIERWLNRQSWLSFSVPLKKVRKNCEDNLKFMWLWAIKNTEWLPDEEKQKFFNLTFPDWSIIDISSFSYRKPENSALLDKAIVNIINYFLQKWTFILCDNDDKNDEDTNNKPKHDLLKKRLLSIADLYDPEISENLHIWSSIELASQQHSYLLQNRDRKVWIYLEQDNAIWRTTIWELIDPMNLWKKKNPKYSAWV